MYMRTQNMHIQNTYIQIMRTDYSKICTHDIDNVYAWHTQPQLPTTHHLDEFLAATLQAYPLSFISIGIKFIKHIYGET